MTTDTPRTDAFCIELPATDFDQTNWKQVIHIAQFARKLERELNAANAEVKRLIEKLTITEDELADAREWLDERYKETSEADERAEKAEASVERLLTTLKFLRDECDLGKRTFRRVSEAINLTNK